MSIRYRILLSLLTVLTLYAAAVYAIQSRILLPSFGDLETEQTHRDLDRAVEAIQKDVSQLDSFCHDWAAWDDTFHFVAERNDDYVSVNLNLDTFAIGNFDLVRVVTMEGEPVFNRFVHPEHRLAERPLAGFGGESWPADHPLLASRDEQVSVKGLLSTEAGTMLVSSRPIVDSLKQESMRGWLIMGALLTDARLEQWCEQTRLSLQLFDPGASRLLPAERDALQSLQTGASEVLRPRDDQLLQAYTMLRDLDGEPTLLLRADLPRAVMARGREATRFVLGSTLAAALLLLAALFFLLRHSVISPLAMLSRHVLAVGRHGDLTQRMNSPRRDEFGILAGAFDEMVGHLARTREELLARAHRDGKAEVAISVLHNVGNVLNSVNVSTGTLHDQVRAGPLADAGRLASTLAAHEHDLATFITGDERGRHLPAFLSAFASSLADERERMLEELDSLAGGVEHIRALVDGQQVAAGATAEPEAMDLRRAVEAALELTPPLPGAPDVLVERSFEELPVLLLRRHRLIEILVNLVRNARQALHDDGTALPCIRITVARAGECVRITVADNGPGITPGNLAQVFRQGFTTRPEGHGCGLHSCANAAHELRGTLVALSDGPGTGATFVLEFPLHAALRAA